MRPRRPSPSTLLARARGYDLASLSDGDLRLAVQRLQSGAADAAVEDLLPECLAIVAEATDRRLGVWRIFDGDRTEGRPGEDSQAIANAVADVGEQRRYRRPGDILLPAEFYHAARWRDADGRLRFRATDEQMLAGIHMFRGRVVQMDAGEGKTVGIAFAAALHAVLGRRVHVATANDYLAERDEALLEPVYRSLGLSSGAILAHTEPGERRHVYGRNIVYGAMRELGFDHLRDNLKSSPTERVQRPLEVVLVDEADHALIDEAFTPLIISGNPVGSNRWAVRANDAVAEVIGLQRAWVDELALSLDGTEVRSDERLRLLATLSLADPDNASLQRHTAADPRVRRQVRALAEEEPEHLSEDLYYTIQPGKQLVTLTEQGREILEERLGPVFGAFDPRTGEDSGNGAPVSRKRQRPAERRMAHRYGLANQVSQALRAHLLLQRDVDYLVDDDSVILIDPHTGRPKADSIYQHGLQPAVEARERVTVHPENETVAQISISGFVGLYQEIAGITGTAVPAAGEFRRKYGLEVAVAPPVHPLMRVSRSPVVYLTRDEKLAAVVDEVAARHTMGQPVLVGTRTVEQSEGLGRLLEERGILHRVLNAVTTHAEAAIVRDSGAFGAVTVATHMAGRGTDILLEADLDARIAQQCAAEILHILNDDSTSAVTVDVSCSYPELATVLEEELVKDPTLRAERTSGGRNLMVRSRAVPGSRSVTVALNFALGLCVISTEVHDSSRISLQLNGRSGRQGQYGLTQTFLSLEDRLVNLDAEAILKLANCQQTDQAGRTLYAGPEVLRRILQLQDAADREGEAQRALMQDYSAELDRQTRLYHQRRQHLIDLATDPSGVEQMCQQVANRVASRLAVQHFGGEVDDDYAQRFAQMQEQLQKDYRVDCLPLYGTDLSCLSESLVELLARQLELQASRCGGGAFPEVARLLCLQVCGELWPTHLSTLRDLLAVELLSGRNHKSSVAAYIWRCAGAWRAFSELAEEEFLSRLATLPVASPGGQTPSPIMVSGETERLLAQNGGHPQGRGEETGPP